MAVSTPSPASIWKGEITMLMSNMRHTMVSWYLQSYLFLKDIYLFFSQKTQKIQDLVIEKTYTMYIKIICKNVYQLFRTVSYGLLCIAM